MISFFLGARMDSLFLDGPDGFSQKGDFPVECGPTMRKNAFSNSWRICLEEFFFIGRLSRKGERHLIFKLSMFLNVYFCGSV